MTVNDGLNASSPIATHPDEKIPTTGDESWFTHADVIKRRKEDTEVRNYLIQFDDLRQECEQRGDYSKAQQCVDRIREVNLSYAKKVVLEGRRVDVGWRQRILENQRLELLTFHGMWEKKMIDYDYKADEVLLEVEHQQAIVRESSERVARDELTNRYPPPSRSLVELLSSLKQFVQQHMYADAERVEKDILRLKSEEERAFVADIDRRLQDRLRAEAGRLRVEREAVEQRLTTHREQLLAERRRDFDLLSKRHAAALHTRERPMPLVVSRAKEYIRHHPHARERDAVRAGLELVYLSGVALDGLDGGTSAKVRLVAEGSRSAAVVCGGVQRGLVCSWSAQPSRCAPANPPWKV